MNFEGCKVRRHPAGHQAVIRALSQARMESGLSQRQLSEKLIEPVNFIHRIESGERDIGVTEFITIAKAIGIDPIELLRRILR